MGLSGFEDTNCTWIKESGLTSSSWLSVAHRSEAVGRSFSPPSSISIGVPSVPSALTGKGGGGGSLPASCRCIITHMHSFVSFVGSNNCDRTTERAVGKHQRVNSG